MLDGDFKGNHQNSPPPPPNYLISQHIIKGKKSSVAYSVAEPEPEAVEPLFFARAVIFVKKLLRLRTR